MDDFSVGGLLKTTVSRFRPVRISSKRLSCGLALCLLALSNAGQLQGKPVASIPAPFTEPAAMKFLYGTNAAQTGYPLSHVKIPTHIKGIFPNSTANPWRTFRYVEGAKHKCLLITTTPTRQDATSSNELTSHGDGALVGAAVFCQDGNRYVLEASNLFFKLMGSWGNAFQAMDRSSQYQPKVVAVGPLHHALVLYDGTTNQGFTNLLQIYMVPVGHKVTSLMLDFHQDDTGVHEPPELKLDTTVSFRPGSNPEYYDAIATERGFYIKDKKRISINYSQTFTMKNDHYVRIKTQGKPYGLELEPQQESN